MVLARRTEMLVYGGGGGWGVRESLEWFKEVGVGL